MGFDHSIRQKGYTLSLVDNSGYSNIATICMSIMYRDVCFISAVSSVNGRGRGTKQTSPPTLIPFPQLAALCLSESGKPAP